MLAKPVPDSVQGLTIVWRELPDLPQALGGQFVGIIDDHLVVAGGSYFKVPPWNHGKKILVDTIYTLEHGAAAWRLAGHLPVPLVNGAAISTTGEMLCIGGQTPSACSRKTYRLRRRKGQIQIDNLPDLPQAACMIGGAIAGDTVYIAGGQESPTSTIALHSFFSLSLIKPDRWRAEQPWPGNARILPLLAATTREVYLLSGADLTGKPGPPPSRRFLSDAFQFSRHAAWQRMPDLPRPVQGGSALMWRDGLVVLGGNDGSFADREYELKEKHPGFSKDILRLNPQTGHWATIGSMPYSLVTTGAVLWGGECVLAGGEIHPAVRSAKVIAGRFE